MLAGVYTAWSIGKCHTKSAQATSSTPTWQIIIHSATLADQALGMCWPSALDVGPTLRQH